MRSATDRCPISRARWPEAARPPLSDSPAWPKLLSVSLRGGKAIDLVSARIATEDLELLSELIEAGRVRPQIDRRYPFAEIPAAIAYLEQGHARGKVVATVE